MKDQEISQIEAYLRNRINPLIQVKKRPRAEDSAEILLNNEFIAVCYRDEDEGEVSYQVTMTLLSEDVAAYSE